MWVRLEYRAQSIVFFAQERAKTGEVDEVEPEHLLFAILRDRECHGYLALEKTGLNMTKLEEFLGDELRKMDAKSDEFSGFDPRRISLSKRSKEAIDFAFSVARPGGFKLRASQVSTGHLLLGIISVNQGTLGRGSLQNLDFQEDQVAAIVKEQGREEAPSPSPESGR